MDLHTKVQSDATFSRLIAEIGEPVKDNALLTSAHQDPVIGMKTHTLGETRMTPLAQSFQSLFSVLQQVSGSLGIDGVSHTLSLDVAPQLSHMDKHGVSDDSAPRQPSPTRLALLSDQLSRATGLASADSLSLSSTYFPQSYTPNSHSGNSVIELAESALQQVSRHSQLPYIAIATNGLQYSNSRSNAVSHPLTAEWKARVEGHQDELAQTVATGNAGGAERGLTEGYYGSALRGQPFMGAATQTTPVKPEFTLATAPIFTSGMDSSYSMLESTMTRLLAPSLEIEKPLTPEAQRQISHAIRDKIQLQYDSVNQTVRIRFDPPELGKVDMIIRVDGDKLTVQISASSTLTREAIIATSDRLRADLIQQSNALNEVNIALANKESMRGLLQEQAQRQQDLQQNEWQQHGQDKNSQSEYGNGKDYDDLIHEVAESTEKNAQVPREYRVYIARV
ncbi:flagellar hook-length control protein FliK [Vibrio sp. ZSDZ65]|uniref:Flagellar hook-length control protein FliK n=1 Tax=Vibrio qingdaonensis TaxID=2829491 RepID=A0A9X3HVC3_9VIBR|nr:flagellar hook-length control protein FliK [Vibrio qingdaonensis]MCW8344602.1 flagellar hook-length control protein FliK [Vibrio qingdaonensis]